MRSIYNVAYNLDSLVSNREISTEIMNRVCGSLDGYCYATRICDGIRLGQLRLSKREEELSFDGVGPRTGSGF